MTARPKGANPPKPARQGGMAGAHKAPPKNSSRPATGNTEPASAKQTHRGFKNSPIGGSNKGAR